MKKIKNAIRKIHLWLGIASGLIVFIIAITGCIYVFSEEIKPLVYQDRMFIEVPENNQRLPLSELRSIAEESIGNKYPCQRIIVPNFRDQSISFVFEKTDEEQFLYPNYMEFYKTIYLNPYTGKVIKVENTKWEFFTIVFWIHISLFLGYNTISSSIIIWSTCIFVIMLLSGLVLWWPKKKQRKNSFSFKWKKTTKWKRKNYDLHNILGFYVIPMALIIALTGLLYASESFNISVKWLANGGKTLVEPKWPETKLTTHSKTPLDDAFTQTLKLSPNSKYILVKMPRNDKAPFVVRSYIDETLNYSRLVYYYDQSTAELLVTETFSDKNNGDKIQALNYDIHVGSIGGMPTKILWFIMSLIIASLPVTGFYIWWRKRK